MRKKWLVAALIFSIIGLIVSSISISEYVHIQKAGLEDSSFCSINEVINCDLVNASSYSVLFDIPVAVWGFLFYIAAAMFAVYPLISKSPKKVSTTVMWGVSFVGFIWTLRMAYITAFVLHAVCITCFGQYIINLLLVIFFYFATMATFKERLTMLFSKKIISSAITLAIIFGVGYAFAMSSFKGLSYKPTAFDLKELTAAHFRQSIYDIKPEDIANAPTWGNKDAKVTIVEFSDFQCPFCRVAAFNVRPYLQEFKNDVKFVFVNYPLDNSCNEYLQGPMHPNACVAAQAVVCAQEKGKFWELHDAIFRNQQKISKDMILKQAEKLGIDPKWMDECIESDATLARVKADIELAHHIYLQGTPSVFINQRLMRYWKVPEILRAVLKEEIKQSKVAPVSSTTTTTTKGDNK